MSYLVSAHDIGRVRLNETGLVASVLQNVAVILSTPQQSVPLYRSFGLPMRFIDKPLNVAKVIAVAEITDALREFEPRASLVGISFVCDAGSPGKLIPTVEVEILNEQ